MAAGGGRPAMPFGGAPGQCGPRGTHTHLSAVPHESFGFGHRVGRSGGAGWTWGWQLMRGLQWSHTLSRPPRATYPLTAHLGTTPSLSLYHFPLAHPEPRLVPQPRSGPLCSCISIPIDDASSTNPGNDVPTFSVSLTQIEPDTTNPAIANAIAIR